MLARARERRKHTPLAARRGVAAAKCDVPYQSLIKTWLSEKVDAARTKRWPRGNNWRRLSLSPRFPTALTE